ncbi:MAG: hypothetical protein K8H88_04215 [Sandaracinaceae bacterium]|nr:hypothetical protein [Sandaracinaceae bacterium]
MLVDEADRRRRALILATESKPRLEGWIAGRAQERSEAMRGVVLVEPSCLGRPALRPDETAVPIQDPREVERIVRSSRVGLQHTPRRAGSVDRSEDFNVAEPKDALDQRGTPKAVAGLPLATLAGRKLRPARRHCSNPICGRKIRLNRFESLRRKVPTLCELLRQKRNEIAR